VLVAVTSAVAGVQSGVFLYNVVWKAVVDVPCNLQRVVEDSTTRCREESVSLATFYNAL